VELYQLDVMEEVSNVETVLMELVLIINAQPVLHPLPVDTKTVVKFTILLAKYFKIAVPVLVIKHAKMVTV